MTPWIVVFIFTAFVVLAAYLDFRKSASAALDEAMEKVALRGSQGAKTATPTSRRELETSSFEAYTHCGGCGKLDYHPMREPKPISPEYAEALEKLDRHVELVAWGGDLVRSIVDQRMPRVRETDFDVIRTCSSCSHEWGQR